jgi:uncharacterized protein involved in outer membrane biogenesis
VRRLSRRTLVGVGAALSVLAAIITCLVIFDWNWLRGPIGRYASAQLKREVAITGDLRIHPWSPSPKVAACGIRIGQPDWARQLEREAESGNRFRLHSRSKYMIYKPFSA